MNDGRTHTGVTKGRAARARDLALHAWILAVAVWAAVAADILSPGRLGRFSGQPKGNDFVQFYVMGSLVRTGAYGTLVDDAGFREAQRPYLREGARLSYPAIYGPQIGVLFLPFAWVPYLVAYAIWALLSVALIAWAVRIFWRARNVLKPWSSAVWAVTAAFPPLGYLILAGQLSSIAVAALAMLTLALERESRVLAGVAVGILGYKASLFAPALIVCLASGQWLISAIAVIVAAAQVLGTTPLMGVDVVAGFIRNSFKAASNPDALVTYPYLTVSLRAFWVKLLPAEWARVAYLITALVSVGLAARAWRKHSDPLLRVGILSLAIALASPHLFLYDLVILVPAFVAAAGILLEQQRGWFRAVVYMAYLSPFAVPLAAFTSIQPVTVVLAVWFAMMATIPTTRPVPDGP